MTAFGTVSTAVEAMKRGAADYLTKPFERDELLLVIEKVMRQRRLEDEVASLRGVLKERYRLDNIIGASPPMQQVFSLIERVSCTDVPVLITGESGTGKELVARAIHQNSSRAKGPFVGLNCAAVPETLLESEFFGHERGAFTGATRSHAGRFEQASGGTLFLDEIGAMRVDLQAKLLRAIQEGEVQRLGWNVDAARWTCGFSPPAARTWSRRSGARPSARISTTGSTWCRSCCLRCGNGRATSRCWSIISFRPRPASSSRGEISLTPRVLDRLQRHAWPGNVRELENCIERMVVLARGDRLDLEDLPPAVLKGVDAAPGDLEGFQLPADGVVLPELEQHLIRQALERSRGQLRPAARLLGISYKTLQYRARKYGLAREQFGDDDDPSATP